MEQITVNVLFKLFFIAICIDFVTGIIASAKLGKLKSRTCSDGMFRSIGECVVLLVFVLGTYFVPQLSNIFEVFTIGFIFKECLSIVENLVKLDVWIPNSLKNMLAVGIEKIDKKDGI